MVEGSSICNPFTRLTNERETRKMLAVVVARDVSVAMRNHLFRFGDKTFKQSEGGSIGSEWTCVV